MVNYYEILGLDFSASIDIIETKLDEQYAKWRALVTHHDSEIVSQATKAIQTIEQARSVLTDAAKKQVYDRDLQAELATMGGVVDPIVVGQAPMGQPGFGMAIPRRPIAPAPSQPPAERLDAWICQKCQKPNPKGTTFCAKCGAIVGVNCPNCGVLGDYSDKFCSECGKDKEAVFEENKAMRLKDLSESISRVESDIDFAKNNPMEFAKKNLGHKNLSGCSLVIVVISIILLVMLSILYISNDSPFIGIFMILAAIGSVVFSLLSRENKVKKQVTQHISTMEGQIQSMKQQVIQIRQEKY